MTAELYSLFLSTLLLFVLLMVQGGLIPVAQGFAWGLGSRDEPQDRTVMQGRMDRIVANQMESLALFTPVVVILTLADLSSSSTEWGAQLHVASRAAFAAIYAAGIPVLRSVAWGVGVAGLVMVAWPLF